MFDFQWRSTTSISRFFVPLQVKHSRLLYKSIGNHETPWDTKETWSCLFLVTRHILFLSNHAQLLKPRLDEECVCQTLFMGIIFFKFVTSLKALLLDMCSYFLLIPTRQTTLAHLGRKVPWVIDLVRLIAECISNYVDVVVFFWRVSFFNDLSR